MLSQIQNMLENLLTLLFINSWTLIYNTSRYQIFKNMLRNIFPLNDELVLMFLNKKIHKWRFGVQPVLLQFYNCCFHTNFKMSVRQFEFLMAELGTHLGKPNNNYRASA